MPREGMMAKEKRKLRGMQEARSIFPYGESVTIWGQERVAAQGCRRILTYTSVCIRLKLRKTVLAVRGQDLVCVSFSCGCATLSGRIVSVTFETPEGVKG